MTFRFKTRRMDGSYRRGLSHLSVGDKVMSRFRANWRGVVLALDPATGMATVRMTQDRRGTPVRKPKTFVYHCNWFTKIDTSDLE